MLDSLSPQRRRLALGVAGLVAVAVIAAVAVVAVRSTQGGTTPVAQDQLGPVVLVPGYGGDTSDLDPLATALRAQGRDVVVFRPTGGLTGDLRVQAKRLGAVADAAMKDARAASVDVVGYSAGGVVARLWVRDDGGGSVARRVLTLGSPHHGTEVAQIAEQTAPAACPTACRQLVPDSSLLRALDAGDETPAGPEWITLRSTSDTVVTPTDSAALSGALDVEVQSVCPGARTSHGDLPGDPVTIALLTSALGRAAPSVPTGVRC